MRLVVQQLPAEILNRASLRGNEYAWPIADVPAVIEAAQKAGLVNIGGQLQFRIPDKYGGGTCECYWVGVDTYKSVSKDMPWDERVNKAADAALADFAKLQTKYDFLKEGQENFGQYLREAAEQGGKVEEMMCFVWYVTGEKEEAQLMKGATKNNPAAPAK